jgi:plastocyanin
MHPVPLPLTKPLGGVWRFALRPGARRRLALISAALILLAGSAFAAVHNVAQRHRAFSIKEITITPGDTIAFGNDDEFLHQIYVDSKVMDFDSAEQRPGETITVVFPQRGTFVVRCHIHPKMQLTVHVK